MQYQNYESENQPSFRMQNLHRVRQNETQSHHCMVPQLLNNQIVIAQENQLESPSLWLDVQTMVSLFNLLFFS